MVQVWRGALPRFPSPSWLALRLQYFSSPEPRRHSNLQAWHCKTRATSAPSTPIMEALGTTFPWSWIPMMPRLGTTLETAEVEWCLGSIIPRKTATSNGTARIVVPSRVHSVLDCWSVASAQSTKDQPLFIPSSHPQNPKNSISSCGGALPMEGLMSPATSGAAPSLTYADIWVSAFPRSRKARNFTLNIFACDGQTVWETARKWMKMGHAMVLPTPQWVELPDTTHHHASPRHVSQMHNIKLTCTNLRKKIVKPGWVRNIWYIFGTFSITWLILAMNHIIRWFWRRGGPMSKCHVCVTIVHTCNLILCQVKHKIVHPWIWMMVAGFFKVSICNCDNGILRKHTGKLETPKKDEAWDFSLEPKWHAGERLYMMYTYSCPAAKQLKRHTTSLPTNSNCVQASNSTRPKPGYGTATASARPMWNTSGQKCGLGRENSPQNSKASPASQALSSHSGPA